MKNINLFQLTKRIIVFLAGLLIIQTGVAIFIQTSIGADPFTIFTTGIARLWQMNVGNANLLLSIIFTVVIIAVFREWKQINIGTVMALVFAGVCINLMNCVITPLSLGSFPVPVRLCFVVVSCVLIAIGFSMEKACDLGVAPNDLFILIFTDKTKIEYRFVRIAIDITFLTVGFILCGVDTFGSTLGFGTVLNALIQGPLIQFFMERVEKVVRPVIAYDRAEKQIAEGSEE